MLRRVRILKSLLRSQNDNINEDFIEFIWSWKQDPCFLMIQLYVTTNCYCILFVASSTSMLSPLTVSLVGLICTSKPSWIILLNFILIALASYGFTFFFFKLLSSHYCITTLHFIIIFCACFVIAQILPTEQIWRYGQFICQ